MKDDSTRTLGLIPFAFDLPQAQLQDAKRTALTTSLRCSLFLSPRFARTGSWARAKTQRKKSTRAERADRPRL